MNAKTSRSLVTQAPSQRLAPWYQRAAEAVGGWLRTLASVRLSVRASGYDGATQSRRTDGWLTSNLSANSQIQSAAPLLRSRSRDLVRNNPHAAKAISSLVSNTVGTGIRPMSNTGDPTLDAEVDRLFAAWSLDCSADGSGLDFYGLQALAARGMFESGEVFTRRLLRPESSTVPLELQLLEADFLNASENRVLPEGGRRVMGKEYGEDGRLAAYWMYRSHPGENIRTLSGRNHGTQTEAIPAREIAHLYEPQRPGQVRGVPFLTPVLRALRDLDDYADAERFRKKLESCVVAFVMSDEEGEEGIGPRVTDASGEVLEQLEPGLIALVRGGKEVRMSAPATIGGYAEYQRSELQRVASGARMTYEILAGDLSQVNFSSIRAGLVEFHRMVRGLQSHIVIPLWCRPVWSWFIDAAIASGSLPDRDYPAKWIPPAFESIDRLKDAKADTAEVRSGLVPLSEVVARRGGDFESHVAAIAKGNEAIDAAGLVLDSDARRVSGAGIEQVTQPDEPASD